MSDLTKNITWDDVKEDPNAIKVLDHGFIVLKETMGFDETIAESARVSYGVGTKTVQDDRNLIRYLVRHKHTTPLEMCEARFLVKVPLFIWAQWIRHRTANVNQLSARYSEIPDEYYTPDPWRSQSTTNKQGGEEPVHYTGSVWFDEESTCSGKAEDVGFEEYRSRLECGVSRELARSCLPQSTYTTAYWKCDLHNMMHFMRLRLDPHAQYEIRAYAQAMYDLLLRKFPLAMEAFTDYQLHAMTFSRMELQFLRELLNPERDQLQSALNISFPGLSKREQTEFQDKITKILAMDHSH